MNTHVDISTLIEIAEAAAVHIMDVYAQQTINSETKTAADGFVSPLTTADTGAHTIITQQLQAAYPDIPQVSEEQDIQQSEQAAREHTVFYIDPIDGTKEFIRKTGSFTVNIGLVTDGVPVAGVVYAPARDLLYYGDATGAFKRTVGQASPMSANTHTTARTVVASKNHLDDTTQAFVASLGDDIELIQTGSSLKICAVADGSADVYPRIAPTTMEWDTAAADAILRAAGGTMIDRSGQTLVYGKPGLRNQSFIAHAPNIQFSLPATP